MIVLLYTLITVLVTSVPPAPPDTIPPASKQVSRAVLVESIETLDNYSKRDTVDRLGGTMRIITAPVPGSEDQWAIVTHWTNASSGATSLDSVIVSAHPFAPLRHRVISPTDSCEVRYDGNHVTGWIQSKGKPRRTIDARLERAPFPDGFRMKVISVLPLYSRFAGEIPVFDAFAGEAGVERLIGVRVTGTDSLAVGHAAETCWKIAVDRRDPSGSLQTLWIAVRDRRVMRWESRDKTGNLLWWYVAR